MHVYHFYVKFSFYTFASSRWTFVRYLLSISHFLYGDWFRGKFLSNMVKIKPIFWYLCYTSLQSCFLFLGREDVYKSYLKMLNLWKQRMIESKIKGGEGAGFMSNKRVSAWIVFSSKMFYCVQNLTRNQIKTKQ